MSHLMDTHADEPTVDGYESPCDVVDAELDRRRRVEAARAKRALGGA